MFEINSYVVKYNVGVCRIDSISKQAVADAKDSREYYLLLPIAEKNAKIYVPVEKGDKVLRRILTKEEAMELVEKIPSIPVTFTEGEKQRELQYKQALQSLECERTVEIIKDTYQRARHRERNGKKNTAVDEKYFRLAEHTLYMELACALGCREEDVPNLIEKKILEEERNPSVQDERKAVKG